MRKFIFMITVLIVFLMCAVSIGAADIVFTKNGSTEYKIGATENWLKTDENAESFEDFVRIISEYSDTAMETFEPGVYMYDKEIIVGYIPMKGTHNKRVSDGNLYNLTTDLVGPLGWSILTYGDRIAIMTLDTYSSALSNEAMIYFLENAIGYDNSNPDKKADGDIIFPEINYVKSVYLDTIKAVNVTIDGTDIGEFTITYPEKASTVVYEAAEEMRRIIFALTGRVVELSSDESAVAEHKIRIGYTQGEGVAIKSDGCNLLIGGENDINLVSAVEYFYREYLLLEGRCQISADDISLSELDFSADRVFHTESHHSDSLGFFRHNMTDILKTDKTPCFSDSDIVMSIVRGLGNTQGERGTFKENSTLYIINNTTKYCECDKCDGKTDAFFAAINEVAKYFKAKNITIAVLAANETAKAPMFELESNVIVYFSAPDMCCSHAINDTNCEENASVAENLKSWKGKAIVYVIDCTQDYAFYPSTFPNFNVISDNANFYRENSDGLIYVWDKNGASFEFGELRLAVLNHLCSNALSEQEFNDYLNEVLFKLYGDSADEIAEYIGIFEENSAEHFKIGSTPGEIQSINKNDDGRYDISEAKDMYAIWKKIYYRHDAPAEDLNGLEEGYFVYDYINSDYYRVLRARIQFFTWLTRNVPLFDKYSVFSELIQ